MGKTYEYCYEEAIGISKLKDKPYYFQYKNFFGKSDLSKVGDNVDFVIVESFDKKKQQNTEEAIAIIPIRK